MVDKFIEDGDFKELEKSMRDKEERCICEYTHMISNKCSKCRKIKKEMM